MSLIVQKFGGTSVADTERLRNVARIITETYKAGNQVVAVLSAQGDTTDDLIQKAEEINPKASAREMDMLLSTGEQISVSLCAMAIEALGYPVISLTGWQSGISTNTVSGDARIRKVDTERIEAISGNRPEPEYYHFGTGRFGYLCGSSGCGSGGRPVPDLYGCGWCLHGRSQKGCRSQKAG